MSKENFKFEILPKNELTPEQKELMKELGDPSSKTESEKPELKIRTIQGKNYGRTKKNPSIKSNYPDVRTPEEKMAAYVETKNRIKKRVQKIKETLHIGSSKKKSS
ncbi:MAG: hypothetical protein AAB513_02845 [Patescibacteria group bacterium]